MGGSSQPSRTTQISRTKLPDWVNDAARRNFHMAEDIADRPYKAYPGQLIAGPSSFTKMAGDFLKENKSTAGDYFAQAAGMAKAASGGINSLNRKDYMNPYVDQVVNKSMSQLSDMNERTLMANADRAASASSFGGSRSAVVDAVTNAETAKNAGLLSSNLYSQGYDKATAAMQGDIASKLAAADAMNRTGAGASQANMSMYGALADYGGKQTAHNQAVLNSEYKQWADKRNEGLNDLNLLLSALGMSPYGKSETTQTTATPASSGTDWVTSAFGGLSLLSGIFGMSDERSKTDIEKLGKDEATGLDMYAYRYKSDPKTYPKVVGPMAQDVAKKFPGAVARFGKKGHLAVRGLR